MNNSSPRAAIENDAQTLRLGIIGMNDGNGHPYSYSAIFNGYDPVALARECPFQLIREYLPRDHRNEIFVEGAQVTHIWTQDRALSESIARVSLIPNIVDSYEDLIGKVDAVILARDDPWNHLKMAEPFLKHGLPLFVDKQLAASRVDFERILELAGPDYPLMAGSSMRFTRDVASLCGDVARTEVRCIQGMSRASWMRYGHHLLEGIVVAWGLEIDWVRSLEAAEGHDIIQMQYRSGMSVILEFVANISLPIQFTCFSDDTPAYSVPFQDFFHSFHEMLKAFLELVKTGSKTVPYDEMVGIARVILAGDLSARKGGAKVCPATLEQIS